MTTAPVQSITEDLLAELEQKAKEATPGPWHIAPLEIIENHEREYVVDVLDAVEADATYIAAANPATILTLIAALREAREQVESAHKHCVRAQSIAQEELNRNHKLLEQLQESRADLERLRLHEIVSGADGIDGSMPLRQRVFKDGELVSDSVTPLPAAPSAPTPAAQEPVAWRVSDPSEPESGHWLSDEPGTSWQRSEPLYTAPTAAEQPDRTTSDRYRAEPYDEVWEKARALGYGNVTMALAELERLMAAEQPGTLPVRRELLERTWAYYSEGEGELKDIALDCYALLAKEGEA